jgi:hypothetical protein
MKDTSNATKESFSQYSPQTEQEKAEAFRLLDELQRESARQDALREVLAMSLEQQQKPA